MPEETILAGAAGRCTGAGLGAGVRCAGAGRGTGLGAGGSGTKDPLAGAGGSGSGTKDPLAGAGVSKSSGTAEGGVATGAGAAGVSKSLGTEERGAAVAGSILGGATEGVATGAGSMGGFCESMAPTFSSGERTSPGAAGASLSPHTSQLVAVGWFSVSQMGQICMAVCSVGQIRSEASTS